MENSFETKEETVAFLHDMLEWLGPAKEKNREYKLQRIYAW